MLNICTSSIATGNGQRLKELWLNSSTLPRLLELPAYLDQIYTSQETISMMLMKEVILTGLGTFSVNVTEVTE